MHGKRKREFGDNRHCERVKLSSRHAEPSKEIQNPVDFVPSMAIAMFLMEIDISYFISKGLLSFGFEMP